MRHIVNISKASGWGSPMKGFVLASALCATLDLGSANAESIKCPAPELSSIERNKWEREYSGWLTEVVVTRMFIDKDEKESGIVTCTRATGTLKIWVSKSCRIIAGDGTVEAMDNSKYSNSSICKLPYKPLQFDNDKSCMVECN